MTNEELITALRWCGGENNEWCVRETYKCPLWNEDRITDECKAELMTTAADALEAADKRIAELEADKKTLINVVKDKSDFHATKDAMRIAKLEAQLPKEGEWIHEDLDNFRKYKVTCPHCGAWYIGNYDAYDEPSDFNYCPHCGNICNPANLAWEKELSERERKEQTDETD